MRRIFISSVIRGFEAFRDAARKGVSLMGDVPVMSEEFGARPYSSERACLTEIEQADVYVLILGKEFGFEPVAGLSVTQQEFRHAQSTRKPILVFVQRTDMDEKQTRFCQEVENFHSGFYRAQFSSPEELKDEIVKGLRQYGQAQNALPEDRFVARVAEAGKSIDRADRGSAMLHVSFLPQPPRPIDLSAIESRFDELFKEMCGAGIATMRSGYQPVAERNSAGIRCGKSTLLYFEDGLTIFSASPTPEKDRAGFSFSDWYVPPSQLLRLAGSAFRFFKANGGWCQLHLTGMSNAVIREPPTQSTNSFSMPMRSESDHSVQELLIPLTEGAYQSWVESAVKRLERAFRAS
jgi:hypothetical protein